MKIHLHFYYDPSFANSRAEYTHENVSRNNSYVYRDRINNHSSIGIRYDNWIHTPSFESNTFHPTPISTSFNFSNQIITYLLRIVDIERETINGLFKNKINNHHFLLLFSIP